MCVQFAWELTCLRVCVRGNVRDCVRVRVRQCKLACLRTFVHVHVCEFVSFRLS